MNSSSRGERLIVLIEDEVSIREGVRDALLSEGYAVREAADGPSGLQLGLREDPDLILLDLMLPGMDGLEVLRHLRADGVETPVVILTARGLESDRVRGLQLGADDYIVKPFSLAELLARVASRLRAWDRERGLSERGVVRIGSASVDLDSRQVVREGEKLPLTAQETDLLRFLLAREGRTLSRADILRGVWTSEVESRVVDNAILNLRKKLESDPAEPRHILSVRGVGYRFTRKT